MELRSNLKDIYKMEGQILCEVVLRTDEVLLPKCGVIKNSDNSLVSAPLEDMRPLLPINELEEVMGGIVARASYEIRK